MKDTVEILWTNFCPGEKTVGRFDIELHSALGNHGSERHVRLRGDVPNRRLRHLR